MGWTWSKASIQRHHPCPIPHQWDIWSRGGWWLGRRWRGWHPCQMERAWWNHSSHLCPLSWRPQENSCWMRFFSKNVHLFIICWINTNDETKSTKWIEHPYNRWRDKRCDHGELLQLHHPPWWKNLAHHQEEMAQDRGERLSTGEDVWWPRQAPCVVSSQSDSIELHWTHSAWIHGQSHRWESIQQSHQQSWNSHHESQCQSRKPKSENLHEQHGEAQAPSHIHCPMWRQGGRVQHSSIHVQGSSLSKAYDLEIQAFHQQKAPRDLFLHWGWKSLADNANRWGIQAEIDRDSIILTLCYVFAFHVSIIDGFFPE